MASPMATDRDDEQEIDLGRYWGAVVARWWLVLGAVVAGIVVGYLTTLGGTKQYEAEAVIYLGTPLAGGSVVVDPPTQLALVNQLALAPETRREIAAAVGLNPRDLVGNISTKTVLGISNAKVGPVAPIASVKVSGRPAVKIAAAANLLAQRILDSQSRYTQVKIAQLKNRKAYSLTQLATVQEKLANAQALQKRLLDSSADLTTKLITVQTYTQVILSSQARISVLEGAQFSYAQALSLAQDVELGHIVTRAIPVPVNARSRSNSIVVGAIVGLILGIVAAILWLPALRKLGRGTS